MESMRNYPLYSIGVVSELLGVHAETIRQWEKSGLVQPPQRRSGKRFYSERDFKRLQFIYKLTQEGLTVRALHYYLRLYPCWKTDDCSGCRHNSPQVSSTKLCWQEPDTYCQVASIEDLCANCSTRTDLRQYEVKEEKRDTVNEQHDYNEAKATSRLGKNPK